MVVLRHAGDHIVKAHPQETRGLAAEGFPVEEVSPAADALTNEESQSHDIQHRADAQLLCLAEYDDAQDRADDTAVDSQAALPYIQNGQKVLAVAALLPVDVCN